MPMFVALLRGINVGKANRVPMADLRAVLSGLGFSKVATLLNSGNVVFHARGGTSVKHARQIAAAVCAQFKVDVAVVVKSAQELTAIIAENPIEADPDDHPRLLVAFVQDEKGLAPLKAIVPLAVAPERLVVGRNAAYLFCARGILESKAAAALLSKAGRAATSRNLATVLKLQALADSGG